jgi:8-oxo-dGTP pyrophosphatase MutT (NUDIX family)
VKRRPGRITEMSQDADPEARLQFAALPYRLSNGRVEVMLITSRDTRRWLIPKGWPMAGRTSPEAAAQEALEEAGVTGRIEVEPLGSYDYLKRLKDSVIAPCRVEVFALEVEVELDAWPEQQQRERRWTDWRTAADAVHEPDLSGLIRRFGRERSRKRGWMSRLFAG